MATFNNMIVTSGGKSIYAKAIAGKTIKFTKAMVGTGKANSQEEAEALTALKSPNLTGAITIDATSKAGVAIVTISIDNSTITDPLEISEVGLFCKDPDTNREVMYSYCYAPKDKDVIPAITDGETVWKMQLQVYISNAASSSSGSTSQTEILTFAPVVTPLASGFVSGVTASGEYVVKGNLVTAFYKITGTLANMENAESGLSALTISLPKASVVNCGVSGRMTVTDSGNNKTLVLVSGEIAENGQVVNMDYFGKQNGSFSLLMTVQYAI